MDNYFEALKLSIDEIQGQNETTIRTIVEAAYKREYPKTVGSYANIPRPDGRTSTQWQKILIEAKVTLIDPQKRRAHVAELQPTPVPQPDPVPVPRSDPVPVPDPVPKSDPVPKPDPVPRGTACFFNNPSNALRLAVSLWQRLPLLLG